MNRRNFLKGAISAGIVATIPGLMGTSSSTQDTLGRGMTRTFVHYDEMPFLGGDFDGDEMNYTVTQQFPRDPSLSHRSNQRMYITSLSNNYV